MLRLRARFSDSTRAAVSLPAFAEAAVFHIVAPGEQRCFPAEQPGKGAGLWRGEQLTGCPGMVSFVSQTKGLKTEHKTEMCVNGTFSLCHLSPHDCDPWKRTLCPRVNSCLHNCNHPSGGWQWLTTCEGQLGFLDCDGFCVHFCLGIHFYIL